MVLETVAAVVVVLDAQGRIVEFNRAAKALTGYASEEGCGRVVWETRLIAGEADPGFRGTVARVNAGEFPDRCESHWVTKDGRRRLLSWRNSAVLGDHVWWLMTALACSRHAGFAEASADGVGYASRQADDGEPNNAALLASIVESSADAILSKTGV
jgi:PAS domain S-box-containing protein